MQTYSRKESVALCIFSNISSEMESICSTTHITFKRTYVYINTFKKRALTFSLVFKYFIGASLFDHSHNDFVSVRLIGKSELASYAGLS